MLSPLEEELVPGGFIEEIIGITPLMQKKPLSRNANNQVPVESQITTTNLRWSKKNKLKNSLSIERQHWNWQLTYEIKAEETIWGIKR